uniref:Uncharacterized protein n=1 Tax=Microcebus murinus TaxID=30608 RepID=A0A8C5YFR6_MICMU
MKTKTGLAADIGLLCSLLWLFLLASQVRKLFRKVSLCICTR